MTDDEELVAIGEDMIRRVVAQMVAYAVPPGGGPLEPEDALFIKWVKDFEDCALERLAEKP